MDFAELWCTAVKMWRIIAGVVITCIYMYPGSTFVVSIRRIQRSESCAVESFSVGQTSEIGYYFKELLNTDPSSGLMYRYAVLMQSGSKYAQLNINASKLIWFWASLFN